MIAIIQLITFINIIDSTEEAILAKVISDDNGICEHIGDECPHLELSSLNTLIIIGYITIGLVFIAGLLLLFAKKKTKYELPKNLSENEKKIIEILNESDGSEFQSGLVDKSGFTKVKVTRILDDLEGKKAIERRRRGMTNVVILKK